jgi:hypothetical protein
MLTRNYLTLSVLLLFSQLSFGSNYTVGTEDIQYYPHYGKLNDQDSNFSGYAKDVFDHFSREYNVSFNYKFYPIKRLYKAFQIDKTVDFKYPDNPDWNSTFTQTKTIHYSQPIGTFIDGTIVLQKNKHLSVKHIKKIGTIKGFTPQAYIEKLRNEHVKLFEFSNTETLLKALSHQLIDAAYVNIDVANHQMKIHNVPVAFIKTMPYKIGKYHFSTIKHPKLIQKLDAFLNRNAMLIQRLKEKYRLSSL